MVTIDDDFEGNGAKKEGRGGCEVYDEESSPAFGGRKEEEHEPRGPTKLHSLYMKRFLSGFHFARRFVPGYVMIMTEHTRARGVGWDVSRGVQRVCVERYFPLLFATSHLFLAVVWDSPPEGWAERFMIGG